MTGTGVMELIVSKIAATFAAIPFSGATWFVLLTLTFFVWLFARAQADEKNPVYWEHLIIDSHNNRASPYKVGYLVGIIVSTWIIIQFSDKDKLTFDILGTYLAFLVGGAGINSFTKKNLPDDRRAMPRPDPEMGDDPDPVRDQ